MPKPLQAPQSPEVDSDDVREFVVERVGKGRTQPSAAELLRILESQFGWPVRCLFLPVIRSLRKDESLPHLIRDYLQVTLVDDELIGALRHGGGEHHEYRSTIDDLFRASQVYRRSGAFGDAIKFMAKFRNYSPFNNLLVLTQKPECRFFATQRDWQKRFSRQIKQEARPLVILAPMHPVMLVYDLEDTHGVPVPEEFERFGQAEGEFDPKILERTIGNAWRRNRIGVEFRRLNLLSAGWVKRCLPDPDLNGDESPELLVTIREQLDEPSRYLTLCHELAHVYLGHLGPPDDRGSRWPCRANLSYASVEIEAEAVACIVCERQGLSTTSDMYLANFLQRAEIPDEVSLELIAKAADRILNMGKRKMPDRAGDAASTRSPNP